MLSEAGVPCAEIIPCIPDADNADVGSFITIKVDFPHYIDVEFFMPSKLHTLLSIAGSDPLGCAGIQADIRSGNLMGVHVLTAVTAVTSQNSGGLTNIGSVDPDLLESQLKSILEEVIPDAIKIGMVGSKDNFVVISNFLKSLNPGVKVVIDPIIRVSSDNKLLIKASSEEDIVSYYLRYLFPLATVVTPNIPEMNLLTNTDSKNWDCSSLDYLNTNAVIVKGGHSDSKCIEDTLILPDKILTCSHSKYECNNLHGTGCTYSSILASCLALGKNLQEAFFITSTEMENIISQSCEYTLGFSNYGPLNINQYAL